MQCQTQAVEGTHSRSSLSTIGLKFFPTILYTPSIFSSSVPLGSSSEAGPRAGTSPERIAEVYCSSVCWVSSLCTARHDAVSTAVFLEKDGLLLCRHQGCGCANARAGGHALQPVPKGLRLHVPPEPPHLRPLPPLHLVPLRNVRLVLLPRFPPDVNQRRHDRPAAFPLPVRNDIAGILRRMQPRC